MEFDITKLWYEFYHTSLLRRQAHKLQEMLNWLESEIGICYSDLTGLPIYGAGWYIDLERSGERPGIQLVIASEHDAIAFKLVYGDDLET